VLAWLSSLDGAEAGWLAAVHAHTRTHTTTPSQFPPIQYHEVRVTTGGDGALCGGGAQQLMFALSLEHLALSTAVLMFQPTST
jgi:hypothetical protein